MKRTYLSREMTRAMALDHPIGDPFGGPAYGEKNGPVAAIAGAIASVEIGITVFATNALMGGLMIAGGVMSGLGAITGNKTLSTLGMVAGLAGGLAGGFGIGGDMGGFSGMMEKVGAAFTDDKGISGMLGFGDSGGLSAANSAASQTEGLSAIKSLGLDASKYPSLNTSFTPFSESAGVAEAAGNAGSINSNLWGTSAADGIKSTAQNGANFFKTNSSNGQGSSDSGLSGWWNKQGDMTKMAMIKGAEGLAGGLLNQPGKGEADQAARMLDMKQQELDANLELSALQREALQQRLDNERQQLQNLQNQKLAAFVPKVNEDVQYSGIQRNAPAQFG